MIWTTWIKIGDYFCLVTNDISLLHCKVGFSDIYTLIITYNKNKLQLNIRCNNLSCNSCIIKSDCKKTNATLAVTKYCKEKYPEILL